MLWNDRIDSQNNTFQIPQDNDISPESSGQQPKVEETTNKESKVEGSGETVEGSGSGDGSGDSDGSGQFFEASGILVLNSKIHSNPAGEGGGEDSFKDIMKGMDREAVHLGIQCPSDVIFIIDATSSVRGIYEQYITYLEKVHLIKELAA